MILYLFFLEKRKEYVQEKVTSILMGVMPPNVSYEESDQTPLKGQEALNLRNDLSLSLDYDPPSPHLSNWLRTIYCGDYDKFLSYLRGLSDKEVEVLLSKRESDLNVSALYHVVIGAIDLLSKDPRNQQEQNRLRQRLMSIHQMEVKDGHMKILIKLLSLGVNVNSRDYGGQIPLQYCCLSQGQNEVILKMAQRLIRAGSDVNTKDRTGQTPLHLSAAAFDIDLVQLLLANGADPLNRDNFGKTVFDVCHPRVKDVLGGFDKKKAMEERKMARDAVGGSFRECGVCGAGVGEKIMKRCTGCYLYWYCGKECQLQHWPEHQQDCKVNYYTPWFII